ncbi:MAG: nitroreductase family protein [Verrucomicrobiota bacterium]
MTITEAIDGRRSVKHYDPNHKMPASDLAELIRLTKLAPSSFNMQNYRLVVVQDKELRQQIRAAAWDQAQVTDASVLFIMCADLTAHETDPAQLWGHAPKEIEELIGGMLKPFYDGKPELIRDEGMRSSALAGMTLMLAARDFGYESCPMVGFDPEKVSELINLPADHAISFMISVGKQTTEPWPRGPRLPDSTVVINDRFPS